MTSPNEMMEMLYAPYPDSVRRNLHGASLDMLKELYHANPNDRKVQEAQLALKTALSEWDDQTVKEFLVNHLFQPPNSTYLETKPIDELREVLKLVYELMFK